MDSRIWIVKTDQRVSVSGISMHEHPAVIHILSLGIMPYNISQHITL